MTLDPQKTSLGLEYFCDEEEALWSMNDLNLIQYSLEELERIGIFARKYLISAFVVRYANAYPVYSMNYQADLGVIKEYLRRFSNLQCIGRAGLFRYDNSDHALLTGIYAARNYLNGGRYNLWEVNADQGYLES